MTAAATTPAPARAPDWHAANQDALVHALAAVGSALRSYVRRRSGGAEPPTDDAAPPSIAAERAPHDRRSALDHLTAAFRLTPFERDVLLLCAGVELDASFGPLCAAAHADPLRPFATFGLALAALPAPHWSALTPASPLRRWRLVEPHGGAGLTASALRIDERVLHYLAGVPHTDERLAGLVQPVVASVELPASHREVAEHVARLWNSAPHEQASPVIQLTGAAVDDKRQIASSAAALVGLKLQAIPSDVVPSSPGELASTARLLEREGALSGSALLVECGDDDGGDSGRGTAIVRLCEQMSGAILLSARDRRSTGLRPSVVIDVRKPTAAEQHGAWRGALGDGAARLNGQVEQMVSQFNLSVGSIRAACADAQGRLRGVAATASLTSVDGAPSDDVAAMVWDACRVQARARMEELAQRIEGAADWADLVLPDGQRRVLADIAAHVRQRATVYEQWGFARQGGRGLGITALFAGASGTGKTMAAEVLARELRLDLFRIDLSSIVSKYIGETEKNLRRIFDAAEEGGAILLFDEADALFGKRSEVKDSHDRYANIEVSYLLQRMESYRGLAILTTNLKSALDTAFMRRIRFIVQFPFPDAAQRAEIWRRAFPDDTPTDGLRADLLAQLNLAGGNIRSVALNAAFLAADAHEPVRMSHLLRAARSEYAKLERPLTESETAGWG